MITGAHVMVFSRDPQADREFLRDKLEIPCIDGPIDQQPVGGASGCGSVTWRRGGSGRRNDYQSVRTHF